MLVCIYVAFQKWQKKAARWHYDIQKWWPYVRCNQGADPELISGCCQNFTKKIEHRNDLICRKTTIQQESSRQSFDYSRGTDLKVQFDSSKKHPRITPHS